MARVHGSAIRKVIRSDKAERGKKAVSGMIPDRPFRRDLCESAKKGMLCIDDLCRTGAETLCGFDLQEYQDLLEEDEICTCDFDEPD